MKKNDFLTIIGFIAAVALLIIGMKSNAGYLIFWDPLSIYITVGGALGTLLMAYPMGEFKRLGKVIVQVMKEQELSKLDTISLFTGLSKKARREGLLSLEDDISQIGNDFIKKAMNMVVDGIEPESIREIMDLEITEMEKRHADAASVFKTLGAYAPAMGMLGTLIGLIQMLADLSDASNLAKGMGKALITTFYGSFVANVIALPIAAKLEFRSAQEIGTRQMIIEGVLAIQSGVNPRIIEDKLVAYLSPDERKKYYTVTASDEGVAENG
ncbi:Chemotaxis protein PomA [bioreactor metagenome]|uniref:Chemotaxis protein PomA n=1 Tax=bioreactor metagenome TaxID=1076179 RepID=A0A644ZQQ8_9ZZZZ